MRKTSSLSSWGQRCNLSPCGSDMHIFFDLWVLAQDSTLLTVLFQHPVATPYLSKYQKFCRNSNVERCLGLHKPQIRILGRNEKADKLQQVFLFYLKNRLTSWFLLQSNIDIIYGHAAFTCDPQPTVEVNGEKYTAPHILIATGGVPSRPQESQIPGESSNDKCLLITARRSLPLCLAL